MKRSPAGLPETRRSHVYLRKVTHSLVLPLRPPFLSRHNNRRVLLGDPADPARPKRPVKWSQRGRMNSEAKKTMATNHFSAVLDLELGSFACIWSL